MTTEGSTPLTDKLEAGIKVRASRRGFNMPEDYHDAMEIARQLERQLAQARNAALDGAADATEGFDEPRVWTGPSELMRKVGAMIRARKELAAPQDGNTPHQVWAGGTCGWATNNAGPQEKVSAAQSSLPGVVPAVSAPEAAQVVGIADTSVRSQLPAPAAPAPQPSAEITELVRRIRMQLGRSNAAAIGTREDVLRAALGGLHIVASEAATALERLSGGK